MLPLAAKRAMLRRSARDLTTLALGSSHGDYGFDPGYCPGAFNLCSRSQDFRHSLAIFRRVVRGCPRIENLVLFYSVFSPGHVLEKSPGERHWCLAMHEILDLDLSYEDPELARHAGTMKASLASWEPPVQGRAGFLPELNGRFGPASYGAERRALDHVRLNQRDDALVHLADILVEARQLGHRVLVVIPPARTDYRRACERAAPQPFHGLQMMRDKLRTTAGFGVLNLFEDPDFSDDHFGDFDHLRPTGEGVAVLSRKVAQRLADDRFAEQTVEPL